MLHVRLKYHNSCIIILSFYDVNNITVGFVFKNNSTSILVWWLGSWWRRGCNDRDFVFANAVEYDIYY